MYFYDSFTSPLAFTLQILAKIFVTIVVILQQSSMALHTPPHIKAGLYSVSTLISRLGIVSYE